MNDNRSSKNEDLSGGTADEDRPTADPFTEVLLDYASGRTIEPKLSADDQELMSGISDWLHMLPDAIANHPLVVQQQDLDETPPVRQDDPVAQMLGLVEDGSVPLDGRKLAIARRAAGLNLVQLVDRLRLRGWEVTVKHASSWERNRINPPPAIINAIADELGLQTDTLLAASTRSNDLDEIFSDERIAAFLQSWAEETRVPAERLEDHSKRLFATAGRRNATAATPETVLAILRHLRALPGFEVD